MKCEQIFLKQLTPPTIILFENNEQIKSVELNLGLTASEARKILQLKGKFLLGKNKGNLLTR